MISTTSTPRLPGTRRPTARVPRLAAALAVTTVCLTSLTACQWTSEIQTDKWYTPSDGSQVNLDDVDVRNLVILTTAAGKPGLLSGTLVSKVNEPLKVDIAIGQTKPTSIPLPPLAMVRLGPTTNIPTGPVQNGVPAQTTFSIPSVPSAPGTNVEVVVNTARSGAKPILVPVLLPDHEYAKYLLPGQTLPPKPTTPAPAHGAHGAEPAPALTAPSDAPKPSESHSH